MLLKSLAGGGVIRPKIRVLGKYSQPGCQEGCLALSSQHFGLHRHRGGAEHRGSGWLQTHEKVPKCVQLSVLLVATALVGVKRSRSSWHRAKQPRQLGFASVCGGTSRSRWPRRAVLRPRRCRVSAAWLLLSPGGVCRPGDAPCAVAAAQSGASPAGRSLCSPCPRHGGALPLRGLPPKAVGTEMVPSSSHRRCRLGSHPTGLCQEPELPSGQDHTSEMPDLTAPGALQRVPTGLHGDVPKLALGS